MLLRKFLNKVMKRKNATFSMKMLMIIWKYSWRCRKSFKNTLFMAKTSRSRNMVFHSSKLLKKYRILPIFSKLAILKSNLVNMWSLLFQKGTQLNGFAFFSVFCDSRGQYRSDDYVVYIFFHLWNIPQLLLGTDFLFDV